MKINDKGSKNLVLMSKINIALCILLLATVLFGPFRKTLDTETTITGFLIGTTILLSAYLNLRIENAKLIGKTLADERSKLIGYKSGLFAYLLLIAVLIVSGLVNSAFNLGLEYTFTVNVIMVSSVFSWLIIGYYLDKKGEA